MSFEAYIFSISQENPNKHLMALIIKFIIKNYILQCQTNTIKTAGKHRSHSALYCVKADFFCFFSEKLAFFKKKYLIRKINTPTIKNNL